MVDSMVVSVKKVYRGRVIDLTLECVRLPDGSETELEIVRHPGGAAVVALDREDRVCLLRQFRHAGDGWLWELPAGKIDHREEPERTARRELAEEAGVNARLWETLGWMHSSPGIFDEVIHLFLARELEYSAQQLEKDEVLEVHWIPVAEALDWAQSGKISDAKTLVGLFRVRAALVRA